MRWLRCRAHRLNGLLVNVPKSRYQSLLSTVASGQQRQDGITLVLDSHHPAHFPANPVLTASDWLNTPDPSTRQFKPNKMKLAVELQHPVIHHFKNTKHVDWKNPSLNVRQVQLYKLVHLAQYATASGNWAKLQCLNYSR